MAAVRRVFIDEASGLHPVVTRLVMFETEMGDAVAQCHQEVIVIVVPRTIQRTRLSDQIAPCIDLRAADSEIFGAIGSHVEKMLR